MATPQEILDAITVCYCAELPDEVLCCQSAGLPTLISCCPGQAWVRLISVVPDGQQNYAPCGPVLWVAEFELGIYRCAPQDCGPLDPQCCEAETEVSAQLIQDRASMMRALTCCDGTRDFRRDITYGSFMIEGPIGGCVAATLRVRVRFTDQCGC